MISKYKVLILLSVGTCSTNLSPHDWLEMLEERELYCCNKAMKAGKAPTALYRSKIFLQSRYVMYVVV